MANPQNKVKNTLARFGLLLVGWMALFSVARPDAWREAWAQERVGTGASAEEIRSARARWDALSQDQQAELKRRFEHLQELNSKERTSLEKRAKRYTQLEKQVLSRLSEQERRRLKGLPKQQREEVISELVDQERRDKGRRVASKLPPEMREWMKSASPKEREARLERFTSQVRGRISARAVEDFAKALGYGEAEIKRLERLPLQERMAVVMRLRKKLTEQQLQESGLPGGFTQERWQALEALPPEEFLREVWRLQNDGVLSGVFDVGAAKGSESRKKSREFAREIRRVMRIQPGELLEVSDLPRAERRQRIAQRRRVQSVEALRKYDVMTPAELEALEALDDEAVLERVRAWMDQRMQERAARHKSRD